MAELTLDGYPLLSLRGVSFVRDLALGTSFASAMGKGRGGGGGHGRCSQNRVPLPCL